MPQMSPLMWFPLMLSFNSLLMIFMVNIFPTNNKKMITNLKLSLNPVTILW